MRIITAVSLPEMQRKNQYCNYSAEQAGRWCRVSMRIHPAAYKKKRSDDNKVDVWCYNSVLELHEGYLSPIKSTRK